MSGLYKQTYDRSYLGVWKKTHGGYDWFYDPKEATKIAQADPRYIKKKKSKTNKLKFSKSCKVCDVREANSKHHIRPKSMGGKKIVKICRDCHMEINHHFSNWELAKLFKEGIYPTTQTFNDMLKLRRQDTV